MWKFSSGTAKNWSQQISTIFFLAAYADRKWDIASRRQVLWLEFSNIFEVWRRFSRITYMMCIYGLPYMKVLLGVLPKTGLKRYLPFFFLSAYADRKWNIVSPSLHGGEMPFARLFSSATFNLRDIHLSDILFVRHFNFATSQLRDVPVAWHFSCATTQLGDISIDRHFNCATFQLRDISTARYSICATYQLRDIPFARLFNCATCICATTDWRDFFSSCLGPLLVSLD